MTHVAEPPVAGGGDAAAVERVNHWINGARVAGTSERHGPVYNPATGEIAREVDFASVEEVDAAVAAAHEAFLGWRSTSIRPTSWAWPMPRPWRTRSASATACATPVCG